MHDAKQKSFKTTIGGFLKNRTTLAGIVLILLIIIASVFSPYFLSLFNLQSLMRDIAFIGIVALAQSLLLLLGELDLSVGKVATFSGIFIGRLMPEVGFNPFLSLIDGILCGAVLGAINGLLITMLRINAMVATNGMQGV